MKNIKVFIHFILLVTALIACSPQAAAVEITPTQPEPTQTEFIPTETITSTALPTATFASSETPSPHNLFVLFH